jgi:hypothetical protein
MKKILCLSLLAIAAASCASPKKTDPRYPPQPIGCKVMLFRGPVPSSVKFDHLGRVDMICGELIADSDCLRGLMDEACKLGGDVLYDVLEPSKPAPDKIKYDGRVGHTRIAASAPPPSR